MIDLHTHSSASDGSLSPAELVEKAFSRGVKVLALTDHDTIDGIDAAKTRALERDIRFISGVELEIAWESGGLGSEPPGEFHLLGLGISKPAPSLLQVLAGLEQRRELRNLEILEKMKTMSIDVEYDEIKRLSHGRIIGRPHFASLLVARRIVKNREMAFDKFLGKGRPLYVPKVGVDFPGAVLAIHESGGIAVLAHPLSLYVSWGRLPALLERLKEQGLDGIEAWHPNTKLRAAERLEALGKSLDFFISAGSDYHGPSRPDRELGMSAGKRPIGDEILSAIEEKLGRGLES